MLGCPKCILADELAAIENITGHATMAVDNDGSVTWGGDTVMDWDSSKTVGVACSSCGWEYIGTDWKDQLVSIESAEERQHREAIADLRALRASLG